MKITGGILIFSNTFVGGLFKNIPMHKIKKTFILIALPLLMAMMFYGCDVVQQAQKMVNLTQCQFKIQSVDNIRLAGINVQNIKSKNELGLMDVQRLMTAIATNSFPLTFTLNMGAKNPNTSPAGMNAMEWILFIDNIQMVSGRVSQAVTIPANQGSAVIPLSINLDLKKILKGKTADAILNFGLNLAGSGNKPTRFMMKIKPTIMIGQYPLTYPDYISVGTEFTSH
jgi:hypothetical protein